VSLASVSPLPSIFSVGPARFERREFTFGNVET
jgi:hypothetical protein